MLVSINIISLEKFTAIYLTQNKPVGLSQLTLQHNSKTLHGISPFNVFIAVEKVAYD